MDAIFSDQTDLELFWVAFMLAVCNIILSYQLLMHIKIVLLSTILFSKENHTSMVIPLNYKNNSNSIGVNECVERYNYISIHTTYKYIYNKRGFF